MDIISPQRQLGGRKRLRSDEQYDRVTKRVSSIRIRDRPYAAPEWPTTQQAQNIPLHVGMSGDESMMMDEPQQISSLPHAVPPLPPPVNSHAGPTVETAATLSAPMVMELMVQTPQTTPLPMVTSGAKKRFAVGPRNDCQRCKAGEPGHYGHWI